MLVVLQKNSLCLFYFLSIPNGPAGLLVSVNEEPVHAIGILHHICRGKTSQSDPQFTRRRGFIET